VITVSEPSSSSSEIGVVNWVGRFEPVTMGLVGGANCTVAVGSATDFVGKGADTKGLVAGVAAPGRGAEVLRGMVGAGVGAPLGAPGFSLIVGAGAGRGAPGAVLRGMVGAGVGAPPGAVAVGRVGAGTVAAGGLIMLTVGVGGLTTTGGATGADGGATGASLAFNVTRTVSAFDGTPVGASDGVFWSSLMGLMVCEVEKSQK